MNDHHDQHEHTELYLQGDPESQALDRELQRLGQHERDAMPDGAGARILDAVSKTMAPAPISIQENGPTRAARPMPTPSPWSIRVAAAALLATASTLLIVAALRTGAAQPPSSPTAPGFSLASFEQDLDAYLSLEPVDGGEELTEAVTDWELWAQSLDTEIDTALYGLDLTEPFEDDGAL